MSKLFWRFYQYKTGRLLKDLAAQKVLWSSEDQCHHTYLQVIGEIYWRVKQ